MAPEAFFCPISIIFAFIMASSRFVGTNPYKSMDMFGSNPDIKSARILSAGIVLLLSTFLQFAWKSIAYSSIVLSACLQLLYFKYQVFFLASKANFVRNTCWKYPQLVMKVFISSYHLAAAPTRYPPMIWNLLCSDHLFASAILLYHSNHSLRSFASVPLNSVSLTWFDSLSTWFTPRFISVSAFTSAAIFGSNLLTFPPGSRLKSPPNPPPNPDGGNGDSGGGLLLLLFPRGGLLLLLFPKASNPLIGFAPTVSKYEK